VKTKDVINLDQIVQQFKDVLKDYSDVMMDLVYQISLIVDQ